MDATLMVYIASGLLLLSAAGVGVFFYVRYAYRDFCRREELAHRISILKREIGSARAFVNERYDHAFDHSIRDNIIPKMEFIQKLISHKPPEEQERELRFLRDMLIETFTRLKDSYDDVPAVVAPLNSLRDRLVQEHLQWLRDHMEDTI